jgi:hypothetical protein
MFLGLLDPDPDPLVRSRSGSTPKCHGSGTLEKTLFDNQKKVVMGILGVPCKKDEPCTVHVGKRERNFHLEIEGSLVFCSLATQRTLLIRISLPDIKLFFVYVRSLLELDQSASGPNFSTSTEN